MSHVIFIPLPTFTVHRRFCPAPSSSFLRSAGFSSCSKRQYVAFVSNTFSCVLSLYINGNSKQSGNHTSQYPTWNYWNHCLVVWSWAVSEGDIEEHRSLVRWPLQSPPSFSKDIGERQEAQILKFNALPPPPPPPTHLVCHVHLIANFLSFHMSLVVVVNCGAGNALRGFEISMFYCFLKLYFIHISKDILLLRALNAIKQCEWYFSGKP